MDMAHWAHCTSDSRWFVSDDHSRDFASLDMLSAIIDSDLAACLAEFECAAGVDPVDLEHLSMATFLRVLLLSTLLPSMSDRTACRMASTVPACRRFVGLPQDRVVDVDAFERMKRRLRHHPAMWTFYKMIVSPARAHYSAQRQRKRTIPAANGKSATAVV